MYCLKWKWERFEIISWKGWLFQSILILIILIRCQIILCASVITLLVFQHFLPMTKFWKYASHEIKTYTMLWSVNDVQLQTHKKKPGWVCTKIKQFIWSILPKTCCSKFLAGLSNKSKESYAALRRSVFSRENFLETHFWQISAQTSQF